MDLHQNVTTPVDEYPCHDARFCKGTTHLVVGTSGSGKTSRVCEMIRLKNTLIIGGADIKNVVFCYADWQPIYTQLKDDGIVTKWVNKLPTNEEFLDMVTPYQFKGGSIVVIDDFMSGINMDLQNIVTNSTRHFNTSTFLLFQSLFPGGKGREYAREISMQSKYIHVFKNPRDNHQFSVLARQVFPGKAKWLTDAYHKITQPPYSCILLDLIVGTDEKIRVRSNYLPKEGPMKVWIER